MGYCIDYFKPFYKPHNATEHLGLLCYDRRIMTDGLTNVTEKLKLLYAT